MGRLILVIIVGLVSGCSTKGVEDDIYWTVSSDLSALYLTGDVVTAKQALWRQIRLDEFYISSGKEDRFTEGGLTYNLALSYTRLALINEAQGRSESSEALLTLALRYWSESLDRIGAKEAGDWVVDRDLAHFHVDSLDHALDVRWRRELDFPPTLYYPRFRVSESGTLEQVDDGNAEKPPGDERKP